METPSYILKLHRAIDLYEHVKEHSADHVQNEISYTALPVLVGGDEWDVLRWNKSGPVDPLLGVVVGEVIHDTRSALDHLVYDLVSANDEDPGEHTQFPIYDSETNWIKDIVERAPERKPSPIRGVTTEQFDLIDQAQPYHLRHKQRMGHPLMQLLRMSNIDKHRTLHVASVNASKPSRVAYEPTGYVSILKKEFKHSRVLVQTNKEFGRVKRRLIRHPPPGVDVILRIQGNAQFAFGESGKPPIATLTELGAILARSREIILSMRPEADLSVMGDKPLP